MAKQAVILLSGGMDSATAAAIARSAGFECYALSFDYGQSHHVEIKAAQQVARMLGVVQHKIMLLDLASIGGSALTDDAVSIPDASNNTGGIPATYVPARNLIFLSIAVAWAEVLDIHDIYIGANQVDYSGYPDCRGEFLDLFERTANSATCFANSTAGDNDKIRIQAPLLDMSKHEIIQCGTELGVDYGLTVSCYRADAQGRACGKCDACFYRKQGFVAAGIEDTTRLQED